MYTSLLMSWKSEQADVPFAISGFQCHAIQIDQIIINERRQETLAKIQVRGIFRIRDIQRNVLPKFLEICMETPCWCPSGWASTWRTETSRNISVTKFCYKSVNLFFEGLISIKVILFLIHELFRQRNFLKQVIFLNLHNSSLGPHVNAASRKSLEI